MQTVCVPCPYTRKQSPFWIYSQLYLTKAFKYINTAQQLSIITTSCDDVIRYVLDTWYSFQCMLDLPMV